MTSSPDASGGHALLPRLLVMALCVVIGTSCAKEVDGERDTQRAERIRTSTPPLQGASGSDSAGNRQAPGGQPGEVAGEIFGVPVSLANYYFAKRVAYMFPRPWGAADLPEAEREAVIWENLILHHEAFRRDIEATEEELDTMIDQLLKGQDQTFTRRGDPDAYRQWVSETLKQDVELLENQVRYLAQIRKLRDQVLHEQQVIVSEEEMHQEFLNERHHVGGEMVTFKTKAQAQAFYEQVSDPDDWEAMKAKGEHEVRPVSLMTLEAYLDLWGIPKEQMYTFHAMELGSVGPPMPFGRDWCVYRLLDKRTGDLKDFPNEREAYVRQVEVKKKYEGLKQWIEDLKAAADLTVLGEPTS